MTMYGFSGFCSALGGIVFSISLLTGYGQFATGMELDAITAVVNDACLSREAYDGWQVNRRPPQVGDIGTLVVTSTFRHALSGTLTIPGRALPGLEDREDGGNAQHQQGNRWRKQQHGGDGSQAGAHRIGTERGR